MEPILPAPVSMPEQSPQPTEGTLGVENIVPAPEVPRQYETLDKGRAAVAATPTPPPPPVVTPQPTQPVVVPGSDQAISASLPAIADDVDVIEKEWVDKAKKIVTATKGDPHQQEKQVSHLQADYLMKRYNKQIKVPE